MPRVDRSIAREAAATPDDMALCIRVLRRHDPDSAAELERREAPDGIAERHAVALRLARDGVWDWDLETCEVFYSDRWRANLGLDGHAVESRIDTWLGRVHPDDVADLRRCLGDCVAGRTRELHCEYRMLHDDGDYRWMLSRGEVMAGPDGSPRRLVGTAADVTDSKRVERLDAEPLEHGAELGHIALDPIACVASQGLLELVESNLHRAIELREREAEVHREILDPLIDGNRQVHGLVRWLIHGLLS
jgi:PAS domain S-box-containing protein